MPRNGSGTFNRLYSWEDDAANNIKIRADRMDAEMDGMATALSNSIAVDGQTPITANLPMSGFKHTGVADATEDDEYAAWGQIGTAGVVDTGNSVGQVRVNYAAPLAATDGGTDAFQFDAGGDISDGDVLTLTTPAANTTATPTLENTGGAPTGAQSIVTTEGVAFINMLEARPHRFQWDNANTNWVVLDPAGGVVDKGSNPDGEYVRWGDGTQVCWANEDVGLTADCTDLESSGIYRSDLSLSENVTWTYPAAFSEKPSVSPEEINSVQTWATTNNVTTTSASICIFDTNSSRTDRPVSATAWGRWK